MTEDSNISSSFSSQLCKQNSGMKLPYNSDIAKVSGFLNRAEFELLVRNRMLKRGPLFEKDRCLVGLGSG